MKTGAVSVSCSCVLAVSSAGGGISPPERWCESRLTAVSLRCSPLIKLLFMSVMIHCPCLQRNTTVLSPHPCVRTHFLSLQRPLTLEQDVASSTINRFSLCPPSLPLSSCLSSSSCVNEIYRLERKLLCSAWTCDDHNCCYGAGAGTKGERCLALPLVDSGFLQPSC